MKIAIINDVRVVKALEYNNQPHLTECILPKLLEDITKQHSPDLVVNLGDLIRSEQRNYVTCAAMGDNICGPLA